MANALGPSFLGDELKVWMPWFTKRLLHIAIRRLPEAQRERFSEEWASHINEVRGETRKAAFALGCIFAGLQIASLLKSGEPVLSRILTRTLDIIVSAGVQWLKSALASCVEMHLQHTKAVMRVQTQGVLRGIPEEPRGIINELPRKRGLVKAETVRHGRHLCEGAHVKVGPTRPDGTAHPHAGKTGRITSSCVLRAPSTPGNLSAFMDSYSDPCWLGRPAAMIQIDAAVWPRKFIWVSVECLEALSEDTRS
jgi:hypothetical protein